MLFSSLSFLFFFLPGSLVGYYLIKSHHWRNIFLFGISLLFYAWGEPWFVLVMLASILINWGLGLWVGYRKEQGSALRPVVVLTCVTNLGLLFVYKYLNFAVESLGQVMTLPFTAPPLALPIGISFFTFQAMSYIFDIARGQGDHTPIITRGCKSALACALVRCG